MISIKCVMSKVTIDLLQNSRKDTTIAIYGAQMVAVSMYYAIKTLYPDWEMASFIVSSKEGNPTSIDGIPVVTLQEWEEKDVPIYIAVPENFHKKFHYRRMLDVKKEDLYRLRTGEVDVILPYPTVHYPNIGEHHKRYLKEADWNAMVQALKEISPEYYAHFEEVFRGQYFYNYNMLIAKEQVFKDYCNWLFPILKRTEELSVPKGDEKC